MCLFSVVEWSGGGHTEAGTVETLPTGGDAGSRELRRTHPTSLWWTRSPHSGTWDREWSAQTRDWQIPARTERWYTSVEISIIKAILTDLMNNKTKPAIESYAFGE